jgi:hypothetical protein
MFNTDQSSFYGEAGGRLNTPQLIKILLYMDEPNAKRDGTVSKNKAKKTGLSRALSLE